MDEGFQEQICVCPWCKNAIQNGKRLIGCEECQDFFCDDDCRVCFHIANVLVHQTAYTPNKRLQKVRNYGTELALRITEAKQQQHMSPGLSMTADNACQLLDDLGEIVKQSIVRELRLREALTGIKVLIEDNRDKWPEDPPRFKDSGIATSESEAIADIVRDALAAERTT